MLLVILASHCLGATPALAEPRTVRVGVYENEPKVFTLEDGRPAGIFVDLLDEIAAQEDWELVWVPGTWDEGLSALESGEIDLMPDVAYSEERELVYDFHETPVIESWSYVYAAPGIQADRLSELEGRRVAVLGGSIQETVFTQMVTGFGYDIEVRPVTSLDEAFELASDGTVDAAIANYLFGDYFYQDYGLSKTPIVFNAVPLHFATAEARNADLLEAIDRHLDTWIDEPNSVYYGVLDRYAAGEPRTELPAWVLWTLGLSAGLLVVATVVIWLLRWQVRVRTESLAQASEAVVQAEENLRLAVEAAEEGIFDWYPKTGEVLWSPRNYVMLGYEPGEFPIDFEGWAGLIHPDERDSVVDRELHDVETADRHFEVEYRLRKKSGEWMWTVSRGTAVAFDELGGVERIMGTNADVTDRKNVVLELDRHRLHLEELVETRTQALAEANAELEQALACLREINQDLEDSTAAKSRFLANMSHELRTPLNSIIGFASLLSSGMVGPLTEEQALQAGMIHTSGQHLLELINDILDLSRVEAGAAEVRLCTLDPAEVVVEVADTLAPLAAEKGIGLSSHCPDRPVSIETDKDKLRQILTNIAGNAVKFTAHGEVTITIERNHDAQVAIFVTDTGPGIPAQDLEHVFDAFYQSDRTDREERPQGTGLGLAISQDLAHLLGGEIAVSSTPGEGSEFTLFLPA